ncbi:NAD-dependent protein deacylase [Alteribacillus iranensis]|uniref:protein acetyllysine N-acetyltransferase n=1 Tax=Alteribacillus iranensis TaxID=930128 RepID=A0A1I2E0R8_9BACI|nr:NAD-dependent protein deacylase [Alteribacillus iranensis]SFE86183.1 NAD-dependent deacetylase [Alteribacillus iranensis]
MNEQILADWLKNSQYTVIMSGAGMSTESGLPDFRSQNGLWKEKDPSRLASIEAMKYHHDDFLSFYRYRLQELEKVKPNAGHRLLAEWENQGIIKSVITQNVDGLHQKAGSKNIAELHGAIHKIKCHQCSTFHEKERFFEGTALCPNCGGFLRPNVILFGEMLPQQALLFSEKEATHAELFIVLGSSLSVTPAATLPLLAKQNNAKLVIINRTETELDGIADLLIHEKTIGEVLSETAIYLNN